MKYPKKQFETLIKALEKLNTVFDLEASNPCVLHYQVFTQFYEGLEHNSLWIEDNTVKRKHSVKDLDKAIKLINFTESFELYPNDCNDNHIETAVKKAIKQINSTTK